MPGRMIIILQHQLTPIIGPLPGRRRTMSETNEHDTQPKMTRKQYDKELRKLQTELCRLQEWVKLKGLKVIVVFEGRDAAGKGGTIKAITERVSPRVFRLVALPAPSDREKSQMYYAALHAALSGCRRGRDLRPQLVQSCRRGARDGLLHQRTAYDDSWRTARKPRSTLSTAGSFSSSSGWKSARRSKSGGSRPASTTRSASGSSARWMSNPGRAGMITRVRAI